MAAADGTIGGMVRLFIDEEDVNLSASYVWIPDDNRVELSPPIEFARTHANLSSVLRGCFTDAHADRFGFRRRCYTLHANTRYRLDADRSDDNDDDTRAITMVLLMYNRGSRVLDLNTGATNLCGHRAHGPTLVLARDSTQHLVPIPAGMFAQIHGMMETTRPKGLFARVRRSVADWPLVQSLNALMQRTDGDERVSALRTEDRV